MIEGAVIGWVVSMENASLFLHNGSMDARQSKTRPATDAGEAQAAEWVWAWVLGWVKMGVMLA
jgi:hypothetical protein